MLTTQTSLSMIMRMPIPLLAILIMMGKIMIVMHGKDKLLKQSAAKFTKAFEHYCTLRCVEVLGILSERNTCCE